MGFDRSEALRATRRNDLRREKGFIPSWQSVFACFSSYLNMDQAGLMDPGPGAGMGEAAKLAYTRHPGVLRRYYIDVLDIVSCSFCYFFLFLLFFFRLSSVFALIFYCSIRLVLVFSFIYVFFPFLFYFFLILWVSFCQFS